MRKQNNVDKSRSNLGTRWRFESCWKQSNRSIEWNDAVRVSGLIPCQQDRPCDSHTEVADQNCRVRAGAAVCV